MHDAVVDVGQGVADLAVGEGEGFGDAGDQVAPLDLVGERRAVGVGGADLNLDLLRSALADQQVILLLDVLDDGLVHAVPADAGGVAVDDARQGNHGHLGRAPADIDDHVAAGFGDGQPGADPSRHGLHDQVYFLGSRRFGRFPHGSFFHLGDARGHADDDARLELDEGVGPLHTADEVTQHLLGDLEIGDDAVLHRADGKDPAWGAAQHGFGFPADRQYLIAPFTVALDRYHRGFPDDDALTAHIDQRIGRTEVDGHIAAEVILEPLKGVSHRTPRFAGYITR